MINTRAPDGANKEMVTVVVKSGLIMTEMNPNYEFAGGSCSIQDLMEVDRENLMLVK